MFKNMVNVIFPAAPQYNPTITIMSELYSVRYFRHFDARKHKQAEVVKFYDENNNLHLIDLAIPKMAVFMYLLSIRKLDADARFWLYTRKNVHDYEELYINRVSNDTFFNPNNPVIVVTHGWLNSGNTKSTQLIKDAFLDTRDVNVVIVDWETDAAHKCYLKAAYLTKLVAKQVRDMTLALSRRYNLRGRDMHFIGHSLGAHVVGLAGIKLRRRRFIVGCVTGLDPARPFFEHPRILPSIKKKSAKLVDIIHTNAGFLGYKYSIGHVDFYPNGGTLQPHCCLIWKPLSCEHACSYVYFQEAIRGKQYLATRCDSYISYLTGICDNNDKQKMGLPKTTARGSYYLTVPL